MAKRCPFCQKEMPDEANFCLNCFSALGTEASPESCGAKNGNHDEKPTHKHTKKHISKPKAENALPLVNKKSAAKNIYGGDSCMHLSAVRYSCRTHKKTNTHRRFG